MKIAFFRPPRVFHGELDSMAFAVRVLEERRCYGNHQYLIAPVSGEGSRWVGKRFVEVLGQDKADEILAARTRPLDPEPEPDLEPART